MDIKVYNTIKGHADRKDILALKYIFADSLDIDPTFARYEEGYNYCKSIPNLLEKHIDLTPFIYDTSRWDETYWIRLKRDLVKNFSDVRMVHMRDVAQVVLAEKIQRIQEERAKLNPVISISTRPQPQNFQEISEVMRRDISNSHEVGVEEEINIRNQRKFDEMNESNRIAKEEKQEKVNEIARKQREISENNRHVEQGGFSIKKWLGIGLLAVIIIIILVIMK